MRAEVVDSVRRELRADLFVRLSDVEPDLAERIMGDVGALLDDLLLGFEGANLSGHDAASIGSFVFTSAWQRILRHVIPLSATARGADQRTADRLRTPRPTGLHPCD